MIEALLLLIPAYIANTLPPILAKIPLLSRWNARLDCKLQFRRKYLFGSHKTWRGLIGGTLAGGLFFLWQQESLLPEIAADLPFWFGFLVAFGSLLGDFMESFIKRQLGIRPGKSFAPWDQSDYIFGAYLLTFWLYWPGWSTFFMVLFLSAGASMFMHYVGFIFDINKKRI